MEKYIYIACVIHPEKLMAAGPVLNMAALAAMASAVIISAFYRPENVIIDSSLMMIKLTSGIVMMAGSVFLCKKISSTLLASSGINAFKAVYVTAASCAGIGVAQAASVYFPINIQAGLCIVCVLFLISGLMLYRFYYPGEIKI